MRVRLPTNYAIYNYFKQPATARNSIAARRNYQLMSDKMPACFYSTR